jgi:ABC-type oligopeptide transport system ATPase subunit
MKIFNNLDDVRLALAQWTDGSKVVIVHSALHLPIIKIADENQVSVLISDLGLTLKFIKDLQQHKIGAVFIAVDDAEYQEVKQAAKLRDDISITLFKI